MGREGDSFGWAFAHLTLHRPFLQMFGSLKEVTPLQLSMSGLRPLWRRRLKRRALHELQATLEGASAWGRSFLTSLRRIRRSFFPCRTRRSKRRLHRGRKPCRTRSRETSPHRSSPSFVPIVRPHTLHLRAQHICRFARSHIMPYLIGCVDVYLVEIVVYPFVPDNRSHSN